MTDTTGGEAVTIFQHLVCQFLTFYTKLEEKGKRNRDHGAVDKPSLV